MWAHQLVQPGVLEAIEVAAPTPQVLPPGAVLLRTLAGGICGSDIPKLAGVTGACADEFGRLRRGRAGFPMHEVVGEVVASAHDDVQPGSRVVGWASRNDALAQFVVTDGEQVHAYDPALAPEDAVLIQPLACVLHAVRRIPVGGNVVAVVGLGPIGLLFAHTAKSLGASRVIGVDPVDRARVAASFGIDDLVVSASKTWARAIAEEHRPNVVIEAVGHQVSTLDDAITAVAADGTVLYFGIPDDEYYPLNMERLLRKNLTLVAGLTRDRRRALADADTYLHRHRWLNDAIVTHRFGRDSVQDAYSTAAMTNTNRLKVIISFAAR
jgi:L-iditol 2-dehydrogenase